MKLQTRFGLILLVLFAIVIGFVFIERSLELQRSSDILQTSLQERKKALDIGLESEGDLFKTFIKDYSFWDEMVSFIKDGNKEFAKNNLETGLVTYKANNVWVFNSAGKLVYSKNTDTDNAIQTIPLPPDFFNNLNKEKFIDYYIQLPSGTYQVRAATVVPGDDPDHNSPPSGYIIIGRFLGDEFTQKIQALTQSEVKFEPPSNQPSETVRGDSISFTTTLKDQSDNTVQLLRSTSTVEAIKNLNASYDKQLMLFVVFGVLLILVVLGGLWVFVLRPINLISLSIKKKKPEKLNKMAKSRSQFGDLAVVVQDFFKQKLEIQQSENKRAELERLNKEKTAFLSSAAHELKAPGTIISLVSESLAKDAARGKHTKTMNDEVITIARQAKKMTTLVGDLRSAAEGKHAEVREKAVFDFDSFLQTEVRELGYVIDQKLILTGRTNKKIQADELRLSQVVSNLIRNAAKYSDKDKTIRIVSTVSDGSIVVEFIDQGLGISKNDQSHLFEKYYRAESVKGSVEGLGLGLSICHEIISGMGGRIWVKSKLGEGSHFFFSLPLDKLAPKSETKINSVKK